jgi:2-polyprenyl-3-methyl-5-hydroxy-6-metoxy-1,4-benzoquinol methylase
MTIRLKEKRSYHAGLSTSDRAFDELVPSEVRHLSPTHWTPVEIAIRAASLLAPTEDLRILDIGAGVGKLCAIGARSSSAIWVGIELGRAGRAGREPRGRAEDAAP